MKTYKKPDNSLWAFELDGSQDHLITADMTPVTEAEANAIRNPPKSLADLKADKNAEINQAREMANFTTFTHAGKAVACDVLSRSDIDAVAIKVARSGTFTEGFPMGWKAVDNTIIPLPTVADFDAFYNSMTAQGTANFNHSQDLKAALATATTPEQVAAIVW